MKELIIKETAGLVIKAANTVLKEQLTAKEWKKLFVETGQFFAEHEKNSELLFDELALALSKENMSDLAEQLKSETGYTIEESLDAYLMNLMDKYEISRENARLYTIRIKKAIIDQLAVISPSDYDRYIYQKNTEITISNQKEILKKINKMNEALTVMRNNSIDVHSDSALDLRLKRSTRNPSIGVSFFCVDDEVFHSEFCERKDNETIYVRCRCREEGIYSVINELWRLKDDRTILVVQSRADWDHLAELEESGNIYIPWFYADETPAIQNNTTIFVINEDTPVFSKDVIRLRPRTRNTVIKQLERAGMDHSAAYKMVKETNGLYIPMKKKLFHGIVELEPKWVKELPDNIKKTCLLVGGWTDAEGDQEVISDLSKISYEDFISEITPYTKGEDPLIYVVESRGGKSYSLASAENTWEYMTVSIQEEIWDRFVDIVEVVLNESEALFTYSQAEKLSAQFRGERLFWSRQLRTGMLRTLIMKTCYKHDEDCQCYMDEFVKRIMSYIKSAEQWKYLSSFIIDLCELSPRAVLDRFNEELINSTGLILLFKNHKDDFLFSSNEYIQYLFAAEAVLTQREYAAECFSWILRLDNYSFEYKSNKPVDLIEKVLCPWANFSSYRSPDDKLAACNMTFEIDKNAWNIVYETLPIHSKSIFGELCEPKYREHDSFGDVYISEYKDTVNYYTDALIKHLDFKPERIIKLLDLAFEFDNEKTETIIQIVEDSLAKLADVEAIEIKESIRKKIYHNRYYSTAGWALSEDQIMRLESLLFKIQTKEPEYEYRYLFKSNWDLPLLKPIPYEADNGRDLNKENSEIVVKKELAEFKSNGYKLTVLAELCSSLENNTLGEKLAQYWSDEFDPDVFTTLINAQQSGYMAVNYYRILAFRGKAPFSTVLKTAIALNCSKEIITLLYVYEAASSEDTPAIETANDTIKKLFWRRPWLRVKGHEDWALQECKKYGSCETYIELLFNYSRNKEVNTSTLLDYFVQSKEIKPSAPLDNSMMKYYLQELLKVLHQQYIDDDKSCAAIATVEWYYFPILDWEDMKCVGKQMKRAPEIYALLVSELYKRDEEELESQQKSSEERIRISNLRAIYDKARFCPAEEDGYVDEETLFNWIDQFKEHLKENNQSSLFGHFLGRLLSFSPIGSDGYEPCEAVRKAIEWYADDSFINEYEVSKYNMRGVFYASSGKEERIIANKYKKNADFLSLNYNKTAKIYYNLYKTYMRESEEERTEAENVQF